MMRIHLSLVLLAGLILFAPLRSIQAGSWRLDKSEAPHLELAGQKQFDPVCILLKNSTPTSSGVLVHARWVLTSGHEVYGRLGKNRQVLIGGETYDVERIVMHPDYEDKGLGHGVDLALLQLAEPCRDVKPAKFYGGSNELGQSGYIAGYGRAGAGREFLANPVPVGTKRAGVNVIDSIGGTDDDTSFPDNLLVADFDHPDKPEMNVLGDATPHELEFCPVGGDEGSGLFIEDKGNWFLAGIFTAFELPKDPVMDDGVHGSVIYWTRLSTQRKWIAKAMRSK